MINRGEMREEKNDIPRFSEEGKFLTAQERREIYREREASKRREARAAELERLREELFSMVARLLEEEARIGK